MIFSDFIELHRGYDLPKAKRNADGLVPVIAAGGYDGFHDAAKVQGPGVITGRSGTLGSVYFNTTDFWPLNTTLFVSNFKGNDPLFVYYYLKTMDLGRYATGTTVPTLNRNHLDQIKVNIPDLAQQREIANKLNLFDEKISMLNDINDNLLELADATFKKNYEQQVGNQKLETLATVKGGKRLPKGAPLTEVKTQHPYLRITDYSKNGVPSVQSMQYITEEVFDKISRYVINEGEVFLSIVGTIGIVDLIDERLDNASLTENAVKIHAQTTAMAHYLYLYLRSDEGRHEIDSRTVGTTQKKLAITRIKDFDVGVISETDLQEFERTVSPLINMVLANRSEIDTLVQIRDSLLQELI
ncbi:restriction endonuclease subunit S [Latilactobacillus curvatus]|uniref:restriction endonuclease subunit S n=1 Tax=Latilactobacillus curvatus TaxID=28038 RepID=UPI0021A3ABE0|nr:restriction endonuclease subunit S [Latilactobacillus curvatus]MCT3527711.1 restriction endonuclease subunit S [Latilactobacillus curvatus]MDG2987460.1 restriction endonuclease subunit S [Latilactobacillus curvatus]